jgi:hypothetical protein
MEWNFDYVSADGKTLRRPLTFKIDRFSHSSDWTFSQKHFGLADDLGNEYASFSADGLTLPNSGLTFFGVRLDRRTNFNGSNFSPAFRPTASNRAIDFGIVPNGVPPGVTNTAFSLWNTDYHEDQSNYERLAFYARKTAYSIQSEGVGTGVARPLIFQNNALVITPVTNRVGVSTAAPTSSFHVSGSFATNIVTKTSNYTATEADSVILANASSGNLQITLPSAQGIAGRQYVVKKVDTSNRVTTIATTGNQTIDGTPTKTLSSPYQVLRVVSDGSNWLVL